MTADGFFTNGFLLDPIFWILWAFFADRSDLLRLFYCQFIIRRLMRLKDFSFRLQVPSLFDSLTAARSISLYQSSHQLRTRLL